MNEAVPESLVIDGGYTVTVDPDFRIFPSGRVVVIGNRIVAVGHAEGAIPHNARRIDARGCLVVPGFINCHSHTALTVLRGVAEDRGTASLYDLMFPLLPLLTEARVAALSMLGVLENIRFGATTLVENSTLARAIAPAIAAVGLRGVLAEHIVDVNLMTMRDDTYEIDQAMGARTLNDAVDLISDWEGQAGGRITTMVAPMGPDTVSPGMLRRSREVANHFGVPMTVHVGGDEEQQTLVHAVTGLSPIGLLESTGVLGSDLVAAHCVHLQESDIAALAASGTHVSHNPGINAKRGKVAPIRAISRAGVNVGLGTDNMHGNMVEAMKFAVLLNRAREHDGTYLQPADVLAMATINGARAIGRGHELGSLEPGKLADIAVIDLDKPHLQPTANPLGAFIHNGQGADVRWVIVDGRVVVDEGVVVGADAQSALDAGRQAAHEVWVELGLVV